MKCPHCNQEHPEGTKFCPETGMRMMLSCRNSKCVNHRECVIPSNYKFCPECGEPLFFPHCGKNICECEIEETHHDIKVAPEGNSKLRRDNALLVVYDEAEDNEYSNDDDEPKVVKVFCLADGVPNLIIEGLYKKPYEYGKVEDNGHDVLALERWDEFNFDEISILGVKKNLDYSQTVRERNRRDDERCERQGFEVLSEEFLLKRNYSDDEYFDIYDRKTRRILLKEVNDSRGGVHIRRDWCLVAGNDKENSKEDICTLVNKNHKICLKPAEDILDSCDAWADDSTGKDAFISENRIISYIEINSGIYDEINIRDYQGKLIKSIKNPDIYVKQPYRFGKALGFRMAGLSPIELIYLDLFGNIHTLPYSVSHISNAYKSRCWFVTENTIYIQDDSYNGELINLNGETVFDPGEGSIDYLGDNYLEFFDIDEGKYGVIDGYGNIILEPQFDHIWQGVLR